ncbi:AAA family ATPase [Desulfuromonas acetoxidans]|uniref:ATPase n=1 Tax=Desulfuromonas acetoxidans (strain DSM 684 / 11070) TaxID=281689 RepID=Q1JYS0_DESA6|nr:AAA family ATPase [Desulfuromonas acetoxidans]EAT15345.1 ATPase [Desulfuromonas acetoxidans DSM 684]MBF0646411.1 AAA family ATPase [Desulfuromonas acetoxidans]NVD24374.1 AAA family ATPase [Desulfuromonas acetoxidans]NVE16678.1 AAA family ATPase [Desulfuromonas acetoxidans]
MDNSAATVLSPDFGNEAELQPSVKTQIQQVLDNEEIKQSQIAREAGLTAPVLSSWLKGNYKGDNKAVEAKLNQWLAARGRKAEVSMVFPKAPEWIDTPTAKKVTSVLTYAQLAGDIAVIYGGAGLGKTCTLKAYAEQSPNVWVVTMSPAHGGVASTLEEIAEVLGLRGIPGRAVRLQRELVRKLSGTGGLLVIDEAQHLNVNSLEAIRSLHDATGVGLALVGNESVYARLTGGSRSATFAQLFSRLGKRLRLNKPRKEDVVAVANSFSVAGDQEQKALYEISQKPGALRGVVKTLRLATMFAAGDNEAVQLEHIRAAWHDLGGANS